MTLTEIELFIVDLVHKFDQLFSSISINGSTILAWFWWIISHVGTVSVAIMAIYYWCINKEKGEKISFAIITSLFANSLLKSLFNRPRPFQNKGFEHVQKMPAINNPDGTSFPSGHSQNAATVFSSVALHERTLFTFILAIVVITLIPVSRVYLGVHFPSDTIVGVLLGLGVSYICYLIMTYCYSHKFIFYIGALILMFPFLLINPNSETTHSVFTSFGLLAGFTLGIFIENKFINFSCDVSTKTKIIRILIAAGILGCAYGLYSLGKKLIPDIILIENIYSLFGYFTVAFLGYGIVPFIFKKQKR